MVVWDTSGVVSLYQFTGEPWALTAEARLKSRCPHNTWWGRIKQGMPQGEGNRLPPTNEDYKKKGCSVVGKRDQQTEGLGQTFAMDTRTGKGVTNVLPWTTPGSATPYLRGG